MKDEEGDEGGHVEGRENLYGGYRHLGVGEPRPQGRGTEGDAQAQGINAVTHQQDFLFCPWDGHKFVRGESACPECSVPRGSADV